jgi:polysaccharide biosynthesis/export protein
VDEHRSSRRRLSAAILLGVAVAILYPFSGPAGWLVAPVLAQQPQQPPQPQQGQQTLPEYNLGPGDSVEITVLGEADLTRTVTVRPDGKVAMPLIGDIVAVGLTPSQLAERIATALKTYLRSPQVSVSVREFRREGVVYLVGQFTRPGPVEIQKGWTLMDVMGAGGGFGPRAAPRKASIVRRGTGQTIPVDLDKLVTAGDRSGNMAIEPGDIIMLPALENRVLVMGAVRAPGAFDMEEGSRVLDALARAGGNTERAQLGNIGVIRNAPTGKPTVTQVDIGKILRGDSAQNIVLQNTDVVFVPDGRVLWTDILSYLSGFGLIRALFGGFGF